MENEQTRKQVGAFCKMKTKQSQYRSIACRFIKLLKSTLDKYIKCKFIFSFSTHNFRVSCGHFQKEKNIAENYKYSFGGV